MLTRNSVLCSLLATGLLLGGCQGNATDSSEDAPKKAPVASQPTGDALATVNGMAVTTDEFDEAFARTVPRRGLEDGDIDVDAKKIEVLDKLVSDKLLYQEALRQGLDQDPRIQKMMINSLLRKDVYGSIKTTDITDEELKGYFESHKDEFVVPEKVQVSRILIKVDAETSDAAAKKEANSLHAKLNKDIEQFKDLATENSDDAYARRGGDIGFISSKGKPGLDDEVVNVAFTLNKGELSKVFKTEEGYNILRMINKRERIERTFDQMKGAVLRKVKTEKYKTLYDNYVAQLKTSSKVDVKDAKLKAHEIKAPEKSSGPKNAADNHGHDHKEGDKH